MPSVRDLIELVSQETESRGIALPSGFLARLEKKIRQTWPRERIHVPPADSKIDPGRPNRIRAAGAQGQSARAIAKAEGVTIQYVHQLLGKK